MLQINQNNISRTKNFLPLPIGVREAVFNNPLQKENNVNGAQNYQGQHVLPCEVNVAYKLEYLTKNNNHFINKK